MRERDRISRKEFEQQYAAEEQAAEERRLAPIRKAADELSKTAGKLLKAERDAVLNGKDDQALSLLSGPMRTIKLGSLEEVSEHNTHAANEFMEATPHYYQCDTNANTITDYCTRNGIVIFDAETLARVYHRLRSLDLLVEKPDQLERPIIEEKPAPAPTQPEEFAGIDPLTGQPRVYTRYEVEKMDSETYRRALRVPSKWQAEWESHQMAQAAYEKQRADQW